MVHQLMTNRANKHSQMFIRSENLKFIRQTVLFKIFAIAKFNITASAIVTLFFFLEVDCIFFKQRKVVFYLDPPLSLLPPPPPPPQTAAAETALIIPLIYMCT